MARNSATPSVTKLPASPADAEVVSWFYDVFLLLLATGFLPVDSLHCFGSGSFSKFHLRVRYRKPAVRGVHARVMTVSAFPLKVLALCATIRKRIPATQLATDSRSRSLSLVTTVMLSRPREAAT